LTNPRCGSTLAAGIADGIQPEEERVMSATAKRQPVLNGRGEAQPARLLPAFKESQCELRAVSSVFAALQVVWEFARDLLGNLGVEHPVSDKSKVECFTEVTLNDDEKQLRPDGLIAVTTRGKTWHAFVEAKVRKNDLNKDQIEQYLRLARDNGVDAVITLSNQFCIHPQHHPVSVNNRLLRSKNKKLYHLSWTWLLTIARMCTIKGGDGHAEKTYILNEIIHFLGSDYSGVEGFTGMPKEWKQLCGDVRKGVHLSKSDESVKTVADAWRELMRALSLHMSSKLDVLVKTRAQNKEYEEVRKQDCETLCEEGKLQATFDIPRTTGVHIEANISSRSIICSMQINAPQDKTRASAAFTWLLRQLTTTKRKDENDKNIENISIVAKWRGNVSVECSLGELRDSKGKIWEKKWREKKPDKDLPKGMPKTFEIRSVRECGKNFDQQKNFVSEIMKTYDFYTNVGRHVQSWRQKPPSPKEEKTTDTPPSQPEEEKRMGESA